ncbi:MAG TPA: glycosyltransferase [Pseudonocardiaceae bacterium]
MMMVTPQKVNEALRFPTLVSVVIPARNVATVILNQLDALSRQDYRGAWEVIVSDNGSTDGTAEAAASCADKLPRFQTVWAGTHVGVSHARNIGAQTARGDFIVFCDADDAATSSWLRAMVATAHTADVVGGWLDHTALNPLPARLWRPENSRETLPIALDFLPYAVGATLGVRAVVLRALGGFNESYLSGGDDVEFSWRAQLAGYTLGFASDAVMQYRLREQLCQLARQGYGYGHADALLYRDFRSYGLAPFDARITVRQWIHLARHLPEIFHRDSAGDWIYRAAWRFGRVIGSLRYHVLCL